MIIKTSYGKTYKVMTHVTAYSDNDSLAIQLLCDNYEPFATLTVNLDASDYCAKRLCICRHKQLSLGWRLYS